MGVVQNVEKLIGAFKNRLTLKALANVSPGRVPATPSELRFREMGSVFPRSPKRNLGLELANAFSVIHSHESSHEGVSIRLFANSPFIGVALLGQS